MVQDYNDKAGAVIIVILGHPLCIRQALRPLSSKIQAFVDWGKLGDIIYFAQTWHQKLSIESLYLAIEKCSVTGNVHFIESYRLVSL